MILTLATQNEKRDDRMVETWKQCVKKRDGQNTLLEVISQRGAHDFTLPDQQRGWGALAYFYPLR